MDRLDEMKVEQLAGSAYPVNPPQADKFSPAPLPQGMLCRGWYVEVNDQMKDISQSATQTADKNVRKILDTTDIPEPLLEPTLP